MNILMSLIHKDGITKILTVIHLPTFLLVQVQGIV
jgi:hypothetical protein